MFSVPVQPSFVRRHMIVTLRRDLPANVGFMNPQEISARTTGRVLSDGFENGTLFVVFSTAAGEVRARFSQADAAHYLACDPSAPVSVLSRMTP